jgi:hypothetical protein
MQPKPIAEIFNPVLPNSRVLKFLLDHLVTIKNARSFFLRLSGHLAKYLLVSAQRLHHQQL